MQQVTRLTLLFLALAAPGAAPAAEPTPSPVVIANAQQFDLRSKSGRDYRIFLYKPSEAPPAAGFPVYYFTDANASFGAVASLVRIQQRTIGSVVLVGIGYPTDNRDEITARRAYDLTPRTPPEILERFRDSRKQDRARPPAGVEAGKRPSWKTGGQEEFFTFLETEVKPMVEKRVKIDRSRQALFGHSFGGLFTLHVLLAHPRSFRTYIAASPSLWLNPDKLAEEVTAFTNQAAQEKVAARLLLTIGELESRAPTEAEPKAKAKAVRPFGTEGKNARDALLGRLSKAGVRTAFKEFEGENHGSVVPFAHMRGLRFAFEAR